MNLALERYDPSWCLAHAAELRVHTSDPINGLVYEKYRPDLLNSVETFWRSVKHVITQSLRDIDLYHPYLIVDTDHKVRGERVQGVATLALGQTVTYITQNRAESHLGAYIDYVLPEGGTDDHDDVYTLLEDHAQELEQSRRTIAVKQHNIDRDNPYIGGAELLLFHAVPSGIDVPKGIERGLLSKSGVSSVKIEGRDRFGVIRKSDTHQMFWRSVTLDLDDLDHTGY